MNTYNIRLAKKPKFWLRKTIYIKTLDLRSQIILILKTGFFAKIGNVNNKPKKNDDTMVILLQKDMT